MNDKIIANFTTTDEQIEILKRRGLIFNDEIIAKELLQIYGYYNLINGYKDPYVSIIDGEEYTEDEMEEIKNFAAFVKKRRK